MEQTAKLMKFCVTGKSMKGVHMELVPLFHIKSAYKYMYNATQYLQWGENVLSITDITTPAWTPCLNVDLSHDGISSAI